MKWLLLLVFLPTLSFGALHTPMPAEMCLNEDAVQEVMVTFRDKGITAAIEKFHSTEGCAFYHGPFEILVEYPLVENFNYKMRVWKVRAWFDGQEHTIYLMAVKEELAA